MVGKFRFHLKAPNGEIIAASQGYESESATLTAAARRRR
ncbi:MAG: YegP family protein [Mycobacterium sp.]|nr:YegP family protein [Mycobacterium sp.]MBV8349068.1 YegP family protein [Mycolicibacterium sp.]